MDGNVFAKDKTMKCKMPILILSIVALVFSVIGYSELFVYARGSVYNEKPLVWEVHFPDILSLLVALLVIASCVLLVLYMVGEGKKKFDILMPLSLGATALSLLLSLVVYLVNISKQIEQASMYIFAEEPSISVVYILFYLLAAIAFGVMTFFALKGIKNSIFIIISAVLGFLTVVYGAYNIFLDMDLYLWFFPSCIFTDIALLIGFAAFCTTFLLYGLNNGFSAIIGASAKAPQTDAPAFDPEQELLALKEKLDLGMITEEEYKTQRSEIINRL